MQIIPTQDVSSLSDRFQRRYRYLRLSITDICNFRCTYCLPNGYQPTSEKPYFLALNEIWRLVKVFAELGTEKIRLTGGEPTLRKDFLKIVQSIREIEAIKQITLTTNGYRMEKDVAKWREAGVTAINVSVDSLDPRMFQRITGVDKFDDVMRGIQRALAIGYEKIKVNAVLMRGLNSGELDAFLVWVKNNPIQLRFIELMQTGEMDQIFQQYHLSGQILVDKLLQEGWTQHCHSPLDGPAKIFSHSDYQGEIGLIMPYEKNFCANCNRLRVSATGQLHLCLFGEKGIDLRDLLQDDSQENALKLRIVEALKHKREQHFLHQGDTGVRGNLASIGG